MDFKPWWPPRQQRTGGSGDTVWSRPVALELGKLQLLLFCRSRSVSRGAGCCFSLIGGMVH